MAIELVAVDMDGTTLTNDKQMTAYNKRVLQEVRAAGVKVVICTGRAITGVERYIDELGFDGDDEYIIVQNGAATYRLSDYQLLDGHTISKEGVQSVLSFVDQIQGQNIIAMSERDFYYTGNTLDDRMAFEANTLRMHTIPTSVDQIATRDDLYKLLVVGEERDIDAIEHRVPQDVHDVVRVIRSLPELMEFIPVGIDKSYALKRLSKQLNIAPENIFAIGDEHNDVEMLEFAGTSVAMGNANPVAKRAADHITDTNENSGMGKALEKYVLNQL
ncbi:MAG: Cof-type HAD-IIB family hydrolase [Aerococcus sp.]|nr:Cof-type HAD-IIB family hydrolase [Aerococcus sp.]